MKLRIKQINIKNDARLKKALMNVGGHKSAKNGVFFLEKNDNSYFIDMAKESTQEFFNKIFDSNGPFWNLYENLAFGIKPVDLKYANFVYGRLFFLKNIEDIFIKTFGTEKYYKVSDKFLYDSTKMNLSNLFLAFSAPFDLARHFVSRIRFGFLASEIILNYEKFHKDTIEFYDFYKDENNIVNPLKTAKESLGRAVEAIGFLNIALLSYKFKIKLRKSELIENCELERFSQLIEAKDYEKLVTEFGFYSVSPYDISIPRIRENITNFEKFEGFRVSEDSSQKWRENAKFLCARCLDIERRCYLHLGETTGLGNLIFYFSISELSILNLEDGKAIEKVRAVAMERVADFGNNMLVELNDRIVFSKNRLYNVYGQISGKPALNTIWGKSVSVEKVVEGPVVNINSSDDLGKQFLRGSIILTKSLSPNLVMLYGKAAGIISESKGTLSHAVIIAKEMKLACILQAKMPKDLADGQHVQLDGKSGKIRLLNRDKVDNYKTTHNEASLVYKTVETAKNEKVVIKNENRMDRIVINKEYEKDLFWISEKKLNGSIVGGKALNLSKLVGTFPVPEGFAIGSQLFRKLTQFKELKKIIDDMRRTDRSDISTINNFYENSKEIIMNVEFSQKLLDEIRKNYRLLGTNSVAVRSSASCEDDKQNSFAGLFDSYLRIKDNEGLELAIKKCWASFFMPRAVIYRKENKIDDNNVKMAIFVQKMIEARYSGVMFTEDMKNTNAISIEVVPGTCEKLASGDFTPNLYVLDRQSISILNVNMSFDFEDKLILEIANVGRSIEKALGSPQDIEWCIDENDKLWIVQSRPIKAK